MSLSSLRSYSNGSGDYCGCHVRYSSKAPGLGLHDCICYLGVSLPVESDGISMVKVFKINPDRLKIRGVVQEVVEEKLLPVGNPVKFYNSRDEGVERPVLLIVKDKEKPKV